MSDWRSRWNEAKRAISIADISRDELSQLKSEIADLLRAVTERESECVISTAVQSSAVSVSHAADECDLSWIEGVAVVLIDTGLPDIITTAVLEWLIVVTPPLPTPLTFPSQTHSESTLAAAASASNSLPAVSGEWLTATGSAPAITDSDEAATADDELNEYLKSIQQQNKDLKARMSRLAASVSDNDQTLPPLPPPQIE